MANSHARADTFFEQTCTWGDLGPQVIVSHSGLTVPASSLTLPAVSASGYVLATGPPARLVYVSQPAVSLTLPSGDGTYWLALHTDLSTAVAGWSRRVGSHYLWQMNATQPPNPVGGLRYAQITVAGGVITAVTLLPSLTPADAAWRGHLGLGTMSVQNATAVAITGGTINLPAVPPGAYVVADGGAGTQSGFRGVVSAGTEKYNLLLDGTAPNHMAGPLGIRTLPLAETCLYLSIPNGIYGLVTIPSAQPNTVACRFLNESSTEVGSIFTTPTATAYQTASDARLKEAIATLTGALARVQALRPVSFRWQADGSPGVGFLAHELMLQVPEAVTGEPDALNEDGSIRPQQVDHSKLVPWLTAAVQALALQVQTLTTRIHSLEEQLGI